MKVLHVLYNYTPDKTGSTTRSIGILSSQVENNIDVYVVTSPFQEGMNTNYGEEIVNGITVFRTKGSKEFVISEEYKGWLSRIRKFFGVLRFSVIVLKYAKEKKVDVLHSHSMFFCCFASVLAKLFLRKPLVYEVRSSWHERFKNKPGGGRFAILLINIMEKVAFKVCDHIVVISSGLRDDLMKQGCDKEKITLVPNAVSSELIKKGLKKGNRLSGTFNFAYIGNLSEIEGLDALIDAFYEVFNNDPTKTLKIYGRGPLSAHIEKKVSLLGSDNIFYMGEFSHQQIEEVYDDVDAVVIPRLPFSICESVTPLKPLEALAFGKRLILSDVRGLTEVVDGFSEEVTFFKAGDVQSLQEALSNFPLMNYSSVGGYDYEEAAKNYIRRNKSWTINSKIYLNLYQMLINIK